MRFPGGLKSWNSSHSFSNASLDEANWPNLNMAAEPMQSFKRLRKSLSERPT
jgi:hypothetical protein